MTAPGRCPGCARRLGETRPWCAACATRMPADLASAVRRAQASLDLAVDAGRRWLDTHPQVSGRDLDVVELAAQGLSNDDIAARLDLSVHTVKDHFRRMSTRWGCTGRAHVVATAFRLGYLRVGRVDR